EQLPAATLCAAVVNESLFGAAAVMVSVCVPLVKPVACAVSVGEPASVSLKNAPALLAPAPIVTEPTPLTQPLSEKKRPAPSFALSVTEVAVATLEALPLPSRDWSV